MELACTYETESGSGTCTYLRELNRFDTDRIPNGTPELTVTITGTGDPEPLTHTFVIEDVYPATCEDDPTGWVMGPRCQPDGLLTVSFAYPDIYEATACNILDASGTSYGCTIQPDERFSSLCVCEGLPVVGQHLRREIILADGTQVYGPWKFNGIDEHWCTFGEEATPSAQESQPVMQTCEDQQTDKDCNAFGGCTWWSSGGCYSYPEPVFDCHQYDGNYDKCKAASACTWDDPKQTCNP